MTAVLEEENGDAVGWNDIRPTAGKRADLVLAWCRCLDTALARL
ncbi:hypothetical protein [Natrinema pallidum]|nr:hypothetical protein [Natrinema pallidum]